MKYFAARLKNLMEERGLTQAELASKLRTGQSTVSRWLDGSIPHNRTLEDLARLLRVDVQWLLGKDENYPANNSTESLSEEEGIYNGNPMNLDRNLHPAESQLFAKLARCISQLNEKDPEEDEMRLTAAKSYLDDYFAEAAKLRRGKFSIQPTLYKNHK